MPRSLVHQYANTELIMKNDFARTRRAKESISMAKSQAYTQELREYSPLDSSKKTHKIVSPLTNKFNQSLMSGYLKSNTPKAGTSFLVAPINLSKDKNIISFHQNNRQRLIDEVDKYIAKQTEYLKNISSELRYEKLK